jgi:RecA-family ATPase
MNNSNIIAQALSKQPETENAVKFILSDPATAPQRPLQFVVNGMIARGHITIIAGNPGSGKSFLVQYLLQTRSCNLVSVNNGLAIYLTGADASESEIINRAWKIKETGSGSLFTLQVIDETILTLATNRPFMDALTNELIANNVDVVVFDTIRDYYEGDSKEAAVTNAMMAAFRKLAVTANVGVVLITHTRKSAADRSEIRIEDVADSRIITSKADFVFVLQGEYRPDETTLVQVNNVKSRSSKPLGRFRYLVRDEDHKVIFERSNELFSFEKKQVQKSLEEQALIEKVKVLKASCMKVEDIAVEVGLSRQTVHKYLKR